MNVLSNILLAEQSQGSGISSLLMIVAMIAIFYFFMIRPQSKKQKELKQQRDAMQVGDRVVTAGGIHGSIKELKETTVMIEIAPNTQIKVDKGSVYPFVEEQPKGGKK